MPVVVVGSTVSQCMGSGCPIVALDSNFVYSFNREVIKYRDFYELEDNLVDVFEEGKKYQAPAKGHSGIIWMKAPRNLQQRNFWSFLKIC